MKRGIALSGGGTKGSYELGVWKALNELGIDYQIVTGTSIGSINGALMATGDYDRAYELWSTITMEDMMEDGINLTDTIEGMYDQREAIGPFLKKYVKNKGADISPFTAFIETLIEEDKIRKSKTDFGLVTVEFPSLKPCELTKRDIPEGLMKDYILASSAIFPLFPMHKIGETTYLDGCYYDNLPIDLAIRMGAQQIIAVDLHTSPAHDAYAKRPYVTYIKPSRSLGTMMNFDHALLMSNARMGYQDTMKIYGKYYGYVYTFEKESMEKYRREMEHFLYRMTELDLLVRDEMPIKRFAKKSEFNKVHTLLAERSEKEKMSPREYFLAAAEICGEVFDVDAAIEYSMEHFVETLHKKLADAELRQVTECIIAHKLREPAGLIAEVKNFGKEMLVAAAAYYAAQQDTLTSKEILKLHAMFPKELTAVLFLMSLETNR